MSPKVLSIYQNAKIFLSEEELRELQTAFEKDLGKPTTIKKKKKIDPVEQWGEELNNILLTTYFNKKRKKPV